MTTIKVLGLESSDGDKCECCGTRCPKRRVVLNVDGETVRYGSACAALKLLGTKKKRSDIEAMAKTADYNRKMDRPGKWVSYKGETLHVGTYGSFGFQCRYYVGCKFIPDETQKMEA